MVKIPDELSRNIDDTIMRFYLAGEPTTKEVGDAVVSENQGLIRDFALGLAEGKVRSTVCERMKEATEVNRYAGEQFVLPFDVENVPSAITFVSQDDDGTEVVRHVLLHRASEDRLRRYENLLHNQIRADTRRLFSIQKLHDHLQPIFDANPGITVAQACELYRLQPVPAA